MKNKRLIPILLAALMIVSAVFAAAASAANITYFRLFDPALDSQKHPEEVAADPHSYTGQFLRSILKQKNGQTRGKAARSKKNG